MRSTTVDHPGQLKLDLERSDPPPIESSRTDLRDQDFLEPKALPKLVRQQSLRNAARLNAANTSEAEYRRLLKERATIVQSKFEGVLTHEGEARLEYVRWSLDRIEDARHGYVLDRIEDAVGQYREALHDLHELRANLASYLPRGRK